MPPAPLPPTPEHAAPTGRALFGLLAFGAVVWLLAAIGLTVWFYVTVPDPGLMGVAFPFYAWMIGYAPAGLIMLVYGGWRAWRGRAPARAVFWSGLVYFLPLILHITVTQAFIWLSPTTVQYGDEPMMLAAFTGPAFFLLFLIGLARGYARRDRPLRQTAFAVLAPPLIGVALSLIGGIALLLTSSHWQHRDDFALQVGAIQWRDPHGLIVEARLEVKRDARAGFHAFYEDRRGDSGRGAPVDEIDIGPERGRNADWYQRVLALKAGETYAVRLTWPRLETNSLHRDRRVILRLTDGPYTSPNSLLREFLIQVDPEPARLAALESRLTPASQGRKMGYANKVGKFIIAPRFDWADEFHEGLALVREGDLFGYIDSSGTVVIPIKYRNATPFAEGLAAVVEPSWQEYKAGYIDATGATVIPPRFDGAHPFAEGLGRVRLGRREGYIDKSGRIVIEPRWEWAHDFAEGRAAVKVGEKWGFIDKTGTIVIEPRFDALRPRFRNGRAEVMIDKEWGTVDIDGRWAPASRNN